MDHGLALAVVLSLSKNNPHATMWNPPFLFISVFLFLFFQVFYSIHIPIHLCFSRPSRHWFLNSRLLHVIDLCCIRKFVLRLNLIYGNWVCEETTVWEVEVEENKRERQRETVCENAFLTQLGNNAQLSRQTGPMATVTPVSKDIGLIGWLVQNAQRKALSFFTFYTVKRLY